MAVRARDVAACLARDGKGTPVAVAERIFDWLKSPWRSRTRPNDVLPPNVFARQAVARHPTGAALKRNAVVGFWLLSAASASLGHAACGVPAPDALAGFAAAEKWIEQNRNYLHSVVISRCGRILTERYLGLYDADTRHDLQSATKTVTSTLIGIAMRDGLIASIDQPLANLLPQYKPLLTGRKARITLRHVLTMSTGLRWVDFGPRNSFERMAEADDSIDFILSEPLLTDPGKTWAYNTGSSHLLSAIIQSVSGQTAREYAERMLFGPLEIRDYKWSVHPDGTTQGGWKLELRPKDMIKLGRLYVDAGRWEDVEIVPKHFVDQAMLEAFTASPDSGYGYQMWVHHDLGVGRVSAARGWGGQSIFVFPEQSAVVVFTGDIHHAEAMNADISMLLRNFIVPGLLGAAK